MSQLIDNLRAKREEVWKKMDSLARLAAADNRAFNDYEQATWEKNVADLDQYDERLRELTAQEQRGERADAALTRLGGGAGYQRPLSDVDKDLDHAFRSAILSKNPAPIEIEPTRHGYSWPGVEQRDLLKTTATQALPVSVYDRIFQHLLESSAVLKAGATVINTDTGENLQVPKSTAYSTSLITAEAASITESDPTLAIVTLGAFKYATFFQVSYELARDGHTDLLGFLARQAGESLAQAFGAHLMTGTGGGTQPSGAAVGAAAGVTGPTGTATTFGVQATAGMGTDLLNSLYGSVAEPYTLSPATAFLLRNATKTAIANLKTSAGDPVGTSYLANPPAPFYVDPFVAAMGASAESVIFGDWSRYVVRFAGGLRFERSDEFAFQNDLVTFRALIALDGALVDTSALKTFTHSAT